MLCRGSCGVREAGFAAPAPAKFVSRPPGKKAARSDVMNCVELRGTPRLGRTLAPPVAYLLAAAVGGALAWTVFVPDRWLQVAAVSVGIFGIYELVRGQRLVLRQRRAADDWLRSATGAFVPARHLWPA